MSEKQMSTSLTVLVKINVVTQQSKHIFFSLIFLHQLNFSTCYAVSLGNFTILNWNMSLTVTAYY